MAEKCLFHFCTLQPELHLLQTDTSLSLPGHTLECFQRKYLPSMTWAWRMGQCQQPWPFCAPLPLRCGYCSPRYDHVPCGCYYWPTVLHTEADLGKRDGKERNQHLVWNPRKCSHLDANNHIPNVSKLLPPSPQRHCPCTAPNWDSPGILHSGEAHPINARLSCPFFT